MNEILKKRKADAMKASFELIPPFPREFQLDISSVCNHSCNFCSNVRMANKKVMDKELVFRLLSEVFDCGARDVGLYGTGEPFVAKHLPAYVEKAKEIGYEYIFITTNGAGAIPSRAEAVLKAGLGSIKFSIHAGTRETYKKIHGKDDFEKVIKNLKWVSEFRKSSGLNYRIYVTMVQTNANFDEVDKLHKLVKPYIDEWDPHMLNNSCGTMPENNEIGEVEANNIRGRGHTDICFQPFKSFTITPEGYMSACVLDYHKALIAADLNTESVKNAWKNEVYKRFRKQHLDDKTEGTICYNCIYNTTKPFKGIRDQYTETPVRPPRR